MLNKEKGITLIALVITIIVLLILAGVSIAMLTGQNGILTQAQNASEATLRGEIEESVKLAVNAVNASLADPVTVNKPYTAFTYDQIAKAINDSYGRSPAEVSDDGKGIDYTTGGKTYKVTFEIDATTRSISGLQVNMDGTPVDDEP